jgi:integrase
MIVPQPAWENILSEAEIKDLRFHDLRRTLASYMAIVGTPELIIAAMLGHSVASVTGIYARLNLTPVRAAAEQAVQYMLEKGEMKETGKVKKIQNLR